MSNHIFEKQGVFYFWDEIGVDLYGPYITKEVAKEVFSKYCEYLDGEIATESWLSFEDKKAKEGGTT